MRSTTRAVLFSWPLVCALAVCAPLLAPGYVLSHDMVFVPDLGLRRDVLGLGTALPRAVPSDAVVAVLDNVFGGMLLQKLVLLAIPSVAGWGVIRLVRGIPRGGAFAALAASTLYVWNPFVAERLVLGHWPLLLGHTALPWLLSATIRLRRGEGGAWAGFTLAAAGCALSASSGVVAALVVLPALLWPDGGRLPRAVRVVAGLAVVAAVNAPWWVTALAGPASATSDPAGVAAFAARDEHYGGVLPTLLTLGGVWDADVVPDSRGTAVAIIVSAALLALSGAGAVLWWRRQRNVAGPATVAALAALLLAVLGAAAPDALSWLIGVVPGAGLLRDGSRYLGPLVLLEAVGFGLAAGRLLHLSRSRLPLWSVVPVACGLVLLPVAALPDLTWGAGGRLTVTSYPADWAQARRVLAADDRPGDVVPWPFEPNRRTFDGRSVVLNPVLRYLPRAAVVPDQLVVGGVLLEGEDPRAAVIGALLRSGGTTEDLLRNGVGWIAVDWADAGRIPSVAAARPVFVGRTIVLLALDGRAADPPAVHGVRRVAIVAAWLVAAALIGAAVLVLEGGRVRRAISLR